MNQEDVTTSIPFSDVAKTGPTLEEQQAEMQAGDQAETAESVIPEKFRNAQDPMAEMAKAYSELEQKMSSLTANEDPPEMKLEKPEGALPDLTMDEVNKLGEEFAANGDLAEGSYEALAKRGISKEVVDMFVQSQVQSAEASRNAVLAEAGINNDTWQTMTDWASRNWSEDQRNEWNELAASPNPLARKLAVDNLKQAFSATGRGQFAAKKVEGDPSMGGMSPFRSNAEMLAAMKDPRYDTDPAYRQDVERRVEYMLRANNRQ